MVKREFILMPSKKAPPLYQLQIMLIGIDPAIWRRHAGKRLWPEATPFKSTV
jgi:hypothetical protein